MIRTSPATIRRAAATLVAAAVFSFTSTHAKAQSIDLFAGTYGSNPASLSLGSTVGLNNSTSGPVGPSFNGALTLTAGAADTIGEGFATNGSSNSFSITNSGVSLVGTTSAAKTFGVSLSPNTTYAFTLTRSSGFAVGLLNGFTIQLGAGGTTFLNTSTGVGLLGAVDVLSLFGTTGTTATFGFTTPSTISGPLNFTLSSNLTAGVLNGSYTFTSASISQVPEPHTVAATLIGMSGLAILRIRRRLRSV